MVPEAAHDNRAKTCRVAVDDHPDMRRSLTVLYIYQSTVSNMGLIKVNIAGEFGSAFGR
jgi:hypothetical protein